MFIYNLYSERIKPFAKLNPSHINICSGFKSKILKFRQEKGAERYIKRFNSWIHLVLMLYAVIMRFDSLREITASILAEARKLSHLGITFKIGRSTLADANKRRPGSVFEAVYRDLYATYRTVLSSYSCSGKTLKWMKHLQIIDSSTITLFSHLLFKGVGRHPKTGKKKGGIKVHTVIHANEGVPSDIKFTSAATNDSFMLKPSSLSRGDIVAMDRAYIDYGKFQQLTERGRHTRHQTQEEPEIRDPKRHHVSDSGRFYGSQDTAC